MPMIRYDHAKSRFHSASAQGDGINQLPSAELRAFLDDLFVQCVLRDGCADPGRTSSYRLRLLKKLFVSIGMRFQH